MSSGYRVSRAPREKPRYDCGDPIESAIDLDLVCSAPLKALFRSLDGADAVLTREEAWAAPAHDYWTLSLSIPKHLGTELESIPGRLPYLAAAPESISAWQSRLPGDGVRVGLAWKGGPKHRNGHNRSLPGL